MLKMNPSGEVPVPRPAATVIVLRDSRSGPEVLMLRRNKALAFAGGLWVFPGGSVDQADIDAANGDLEAATCQAALREAQEESGLDVDAHSMQLLSYWTTPVVETKRFHTAFFVSRVSGSDNVTIDGGEIHDSEWIGVDDALRKHESGELGLLPPTLMTLKQLSGYPNTDTVLAAVQSAPVTEIAPVVGMIDKTPAVMFRGDAGFDVADAKAEGARNRCQLTGTCWSYVFENGGARLDGI